MRRPSHNSDRQDLPLGVSKAMPETSPIEGSEELKVDDVEQRLHSASITYKRE
jgi:hypothetical protein